MSLPNSNSFPIKATLLFTSTLTVMSGATIAPSLPAMQEYFLGGLTTFFFLGQFLSPIASQPITNAVGLDRTYILTGIALFVVAIVFFALKKPIKSFCHDRSGTSRNEFGVSFGQSC